MLKLGSLFDGSGTAPLAATMCGIQPVWASEIEPYPIKVTAARFPRMKHLGDITRINGAEVEPVDIICGGSPCQDLSVAGRQAGLHDGERSHLFFEMTRIIKEMREATNGEYPKYVIWENVPGAASSNNGNDFLAVLRAFAEVADPDVHVPEPPCRGKTDRLAWAHSGAIMGDGWSLAWRTVDAQWWGVPQRRRRIYLVLSLRGASDADSGDEAEGYPYGGRAGKILFEREGVRGYHPQSGAPWQGTAGDAEDCAGADDREGTDRVRCLTPWDCQSKRIFDPAGCYPTLQAMGDGGANNTAVIVAALPFDTTQVTSPQNGNNPKWGDPCHPLAAQGHPPSVVCKTFDARGNGDGDTVNTLTGDHESCVTDYTSVVVESAPVYSEQCRTLDCMHDKQAVLIERTPIRYIVRRLTPLECCRLQGFPDWWEDGVEGSESARYRMWGNGMALPNMLYVMEGIAEEEG